MFRKDAARHGVPNAVTDMRLVKLLAIISIFTLMAAVAIGQTARLSGHIVDSSGAVMPGAQIKVFQGDKVVKEAVSAPSGDFEIPIDPGEYKLEISAPDFSVFTEMVRITPGMGPLAVTMAL